MEELYSKGNFSNDDVETIKNCAGLSYAGMTTLKSPEWFRSNILVFRIEAGAESVRPEISTFT